MLKVTPFTMSFFRSLSCILENQEIILQTVDVLHLPALYVKWLTDKLTPFFKTGKQEGTFRYSGRERNFKFPAHCWGDQKLESLEVHVSKIRLRCWFYETYRGSKFWGKCYIIVISMFALCPSRFSQFSFLDNRLFCLFCSFLILLWREVWMIMVTLFRVAIFKVWKRTTWTDSGVLGSALWETTVFTFNQLFSLFLWLG